MTKPIVLDAKSRRMWAARASDASSLLSDVMEFIIQARTKKKMIGSNKKEVKRLDAIHEAVTSAAVKHFSIENACVSATFGAFFRARVNNEEIKLTSMDFDGMATVVSHVCKKEHLHTYLESFTQHGRLAPKDAHIAMLKSLLLDDKTKSFLAEKSNADDKYFEAIQLLIQSTFNILEFINTPFAVLATDAQAHKNSTSGIDLQWGTMQKALLGAMEQIINIKQGVKKDQKQKKKETLHDCPPRMLELFQATKERIGVLASSFGVENTIYTEHQKAEVAAIRHEELVKYLIPMVTRPGEQPEEYDPTKDYRPALHQYGDGWVKAKDKLQEMLISERAETAKAREAAEQATRDLQAVNEELALARAQLNQLRESHDEVTRQNSALAERIRAMPAPPVPIYEPAASYDESFYESEHSHHERTNITQATDERAPLLQFVLTKKDLAEKSKFLKDLGKEIKRIRGKKFGDHDDAQQKKIEKLTELHTSVTETFDTKPLKAVITAFNNENYALISQQRRTEGFWSKRNPAKPKSQQLLDKYCPHL